MPAISRATKLSSVKPSSCQHSLGDRVTTSTEHPPPILPTGPGIIWGFDLSEGQSRPIETCAVTESGFRWLHLSLAHQGTASWIDGRTELPEAVREILLSQDNHQQALVDEGVVACVLHDFERDFEQTEATEIGVLRFALAPGMMITARLHPIRSADIVRRRLARCAGFEERAEALDMLFGTIAEGVAGAVRALSLDVQRAEDDFLDGRNSPTARRLIDVRRRHARIHRMIDGMRAIFRRLEGDEDLPEELVTTIERLSQRIQALGADSLGVQRQILQLREEIDIQVDQRTNQNLYVLSIMTALMLPATFVTGLFGMNTGGFPWAASPLGTVYATLIALAAAGATYMFLRLLGFMRR